MGDLQTYRRISDGAVEAFGVHPGEGWEPHAGPAPARRGQLPLPAAEAAAPARARFEYALERIGTQWTTRGFEHQLGELIGRYSAAGWRVSTSLAVGERTTHLLFEREIS